MGGLFSAMSFASPLALLALLALPGLWWLLRATPPQPATTLFPPIKLLATLTNDDETPVQTPWWLLLLRLALVTLIIAAFAGPVWRAAAPLDLSGQGPVLVVLESDWASAHDWDKRLAQAGRVIETAQANGRAVAVFAVPQPTRNPPTPGDAAAARAQLETLQPQPVEASRAQSVAAVETVLQNPVWRDASLVWMTNGLDEQTSQNDEFSGLADLTLVHGTPPDLTLSLRGGADGPVAEISLLQAGETFPGGQTQIAEQTAPIAALVAYDSVGRQLASVPARNEAGEWTAEVAFDLPLDVRNDIARIALTPTGHAGHVLLIDDRLERRAIAIVGGERSDEAQPLLSGSTFVERALAPIADVTVPRSGDTNGEIIAALQSGSDLIILVDVASLIPSTVAALEPWIEAGGVLIRFASINLAQNADSLLPVPLRAVDRQLGGALTWEEPQAIAPFHLDSPFAGLDIPDDVRIERQILSEPAADLSTQTFAELADSTPLVSAQSRGDGHIVLFHVTADTGWSNLPLSGLFVDMLARLTALSVPSGGQANTGDTSIEGPTSVLAPRATLNAFGALGAPPSHVEALELSGGTPASVTMANPPGFYGPADSAFALNLFAQPTSFVVATPDTMQAPSLEIGLDEAFNLRPALVSLAVLLALADAVLVLMLAGAFAGLSLPHAITNSMVVAGIAIALTAAINTAPAHAQQGNDAGDINRLIAAANTTRFAYVLTGDAGLDQRSREGLDGLSRILTQRTAFEPGAPFGIDPARDELAFYPLIYWPMPDQTMAVPDALVTRIDAYMSNGGTILFDTRDEAQSLTSTGISTQTSNLRALLAALDIPPLEPVPDDHVLTKSFYLLESFPGRFASGPLWVEALPPADDNGVIDRPARGGDGVSPLLITGNDMASAWALSADGRPLYATSPPAPGQREFAFRTGVNIAMYVMTGNYKADQVHIPALLERLVQ